jgi:hypothetical protein
MDSLLRRLQREREEDRSAPVAQDPIDLYATGFSALDGWKEIAAIVRDGKRREGDRERATSALLQRFKMEETRSTEMGKVNAQRRAMLLLMTDLITDDDPMGRRCVHRLTQPPPSGLLKDGLVVWSPTDSAKKRSDAAKAIRKLLAN